MTEIQRMGTGLLIAILVVALSVLSSDTAATVPSTAPGVSTEIGTALTVPLPPHPCYEDEVVVEVIGEWDQIGFSATGDYVGRVTCIAIDDYWND